MAVAASKNADGQAPEGGPSKSKKRKRDPLIGKTINGRFTILDVIARGGMGKVYRAEQSPLGRICALKVLNPRYEGEEDPEFQKRFFLEASTASKLSHANTVTIFDYGRDEDIYYIAMEYIQGRTLYRVIREDGPLAEDRVAHILKQVGRSLREAHGLGVIHRDMKPANVVLIDNGDEVDTVKVLDFGLVKETGDDSEDLTQQGPFMGSPKYMAPEQILGNQVASSTDIYALGVVAFELLTGRVPFDEGASVKTLMAHVNNDPPTIYEANPGARVSPAMEAIIACCLRKQPEDRYQSMDELLRALTTVQGGGRLTESLRSAPVVSQESIEAGRMRAPSWSGPLESGPISVGPRSGSGSIPQIPGAITVPTGAPGARPAYEESRISVTVPGAIEIPPAPPESNVGRYALVAVIAAAVIGAAFVIVSSGDSESGPAKPATTAVAEPTAAAPATAAPSTAVTATPTAEPSASADAADTKPRTVQVTSEPAGAIVREGGKVVCRATPCELTWEGETAESGKTHNLKLVKTGYVPFDLKVGAEVIEASGKLRPAVVQQPRPTTAPVPRPDPVPTQPKGYKESPY